MWEDDVFPGLTLDDLTDALPPVAGAAPGIFDEFGTAWGWAEGSVLDPIADYFGDVGAAVAHAVVAGVSALLSVAGWWMYKWLDALFGDPEDIGWRSLFPHPDGVIGLPPWYYLHKVIAMGERAIGGRLEDLGEWILEHLGDVLAGLEEVTVNVVEGVGGALGDLRDYIWDQVWEAKEWVITDVVAAIWGYFLQFPDMTRRGFAYWVWEQFEGVIGAAVGGASDAASWVWGLVEAGQAALTTAVSDAASWVWSQVSAIIGAIPGGFIDLVGWLGGQFWDVLTAIGDIAWEGGAWLWEQISAGFQEVKGAVVGAVVAGGQAIGELVRDVIEWVINAAFEPFIGVVKAKLAIPGKLLRAEYTSLTELIDDMLDPPDEVLKGVTGMIMLPFIVVGLLVNMVTGLSGPLLEPVLQEQARSVGARIPTFQTLRDGYLRELMPAGVHDEWLGRSGYDADNIELQKALYMELPNATDFIRMVVKEVFNPTLKDAFGQGEELEAVPMDIARQIGLAPDVMEWYWRAHWDLPSAEQGFEMLHRGELDDAGLAQLLKARDVMPFYRDKLKAIAFNVVTRVDIRRMYQEGVVDRARVKKVYADLGYTPEDAEDLTEFVVRRYPPEGSETEDNFRGLTTTAIKDALARRVITRDEAMDRLQELDYTGDDAELVVSLWELKWLEDADSRSDVGPKTLARSTIENAYERRLITLNAGVTELGEVGYTPEDARLLLELVDLRMEERVADLEVEVIRNDYDAGMITEAEMAARLGALHIPAARVDYLVRLEIATRQSKTRRLTLAQLEEGLRNDQITEAAFRVRLDRMGYNPPDVNILVIQAGGTLTIGQLQTAYRMGVLTEVQLRARLAELGVEPADIDLLIPVAVRRPSVAQLQEAFRRGELVEATFRVRLAELAVEPRDIDLLVAITPRLPSLSELRKGFDSGIVTEAQLRARFAELGYAPADVELLMALTLEVA